MSRVKMPHNNRVSASAALRTNDMWSKTIGHDPYAAANEKRADDPDTAGQTASLMLLAKMSNLSGVESRGGCKKCGMLGHMTFQCRNAPAALETKEDSSSDSSSDSDSDEDDNPPAARPVTAVDHSRATERSGDYGKKRSKREREESSESDSGSSRDHKSSRHKKHKKDKGGKDERKKKDKKHKSSKESKEKKHKHKKDHKSSR